ncbi:MAG: linear amide C-N hydrolase, partial [Clostridium sp.]|uniref:linear amide C-N hydrolase n=1 Tax=Clostridium sp. TaxID=1506 RepID=UPI003F3BEC7A
MCTNITLKSENKVITGRTNEFAILLDANFAVYLRGEELNGFASDKTKGMKWKNKYGFVGVEAPDYAYDNICIDGLNEEGLSIQGLYLPNYTEYAESTNGNNEITGLSFSNYILGNFKNIEEVKEGLKLVKVVSEPCNLNGGVEPLHFQINDKSGKAIVVEFINKEIKIYENDFGVLTNSPEFPVQLINLGNYTNLDKYC